MVRNCLTIFSFYEKTGVISDSVKYLVRELRRVSKSFVVVINGECEQSDTFFLKCADVVILRPNLGYDAGAYKCALKDKRVIELLQDKDELVLCNDTFWGPFVPFDEIFSCMDNRKCDFWGLNYSDTGIIRFIQSYFLVFRKSILIEDSIRSFFFEYINEYTDDIYEVLIEFERGIFQFLVDNGYKYDSYCKQEYHIFSDYDASVIKDGLPVLKKKALSEVYYCEEKTFNVLAWIRQKFDYPVELIEKDCALWQMKNAGWYDNYEISLKTAKKIGKTPVGIDVIRDYIASRDVVYIYGIGGISQNVTENIRHTYGSFCYFERIKGYIVSEPSDVEFFYGKPVYCVTDLPRLKEGAICLLMNKKDTEEVKSFINCKDVLELW